MNKIPDSKIQSLMTFKITSGGKVYEVNNISNNSEDWTIIEQQSFKLNKRDIILSKFKSEFEFDVNSYEELVECCSRSRVYSKWLINANLLYSEESQVPLFLKDLIEPKEYSSIQSKLSEINANYSTYSKKKKILSEKYKNELKIIEEEEERAITKIKGHSKYLKVLSMDSTYLPFSLQILINRYTPNDSEKVAESRISYGREVLIQYKRTLCEIIKDDPTVDIDSIIEENVLK